TLPGSSRAPSLKIRTLPGSSRAPSLRRNDMMRDPTGTRRARAAAARRLLVEQASLAMAERWADGWREDLRDQGRPAAGGWPGPIAEARARGTAHVGPELHRRNMLALTREELELAARTAYARARRAWLARCERESADLP